MPYGESVTGIQVGGVEMTGLLEGDNLGQKRTLLEATKQYFKLTSVCFLISFFLGRCKMLSFQLACLFTVVYNSLRDPKPFSEFCNSYLIHLLFWQLD